MARPLPQALESRPGSRLNLLDHLRPGIFDYYASPRTFPQCSCRLLLVESRGPVNLAD